MKIWGSDMLYNFAENMKRLRKERGLSQRDLAKRMRLDQATISKWESCERYPKLDRVHDLAVIFGVSLHELLDENMVTIAVDTDNLRE